MTLDIDYNQVCKILKEYAKSKGFQVTDKSFVKAQEHGGFSIYELADEESGQVEDYAYTGT